MKNRQNYELLKTNDSYHPAASVHVHVAVNLDGFGAVIVNVDSVDVALPVAIPHGLKTVHGEGVQETIYGRPCGHTVNVHSILMIRQKPDKRAHQEHDAVKGAYRRQK